MVADKDNETREPKEQAVPAEAAIPSEEDRALLLKHRQTFIGSYTHTLDTKGRIVVPQAFREMLGARFCITPAFDFKSISIYPELQYARMRERYGQLSRQGMRRELLQYVDFLDALSYRGQECDAQGRVLLPTRIRQVVLGDEKDVEITGASDHVRIVTRQTGEKTLEAFLAGLPDILDCIGALPMG